MKRILLTTALSASMATGVVADTTHKTSMSAQQLRSDMMVSSQSSAAPSGAFIILAIMAALVLWVGLTTGSSPDMYYYSDANLKTDIRKVGISASGLPIYQYRYKGDARVFEGVLAHDVLNHTPSALRRDEYGFYMVDYGQIDVTLRVVR